MSAHYLNDRAAVVGLSCVADTVDHVDSGVDSRIKAYGVFRAGYVVVDSAGNADAVDARRGKRSGSAEGAVAADNNNALDALAAAELSRSFLGFLLLELLASGGLEHGSAVADYIGNRAKVHLLDVAVEKSVIAAIDAENAHTPVDARTDYRSYSRVHARSVAAAC